MALMQSQKRFVVVALASLLILGTVASALLLAKKSQAASPGLAIQQRVVATGSRHDALHPGIQRLRSVNLKSLPKNKPSVHRTLPNFSFYSAAE